MNQERYNSQKQMWISEECEAGMGKMLAHAYVPWQVYKEAFCPQEALMKGTLFPELYGPYRPPN